MKRSAHIVFTLLVGALAGCQSRQTDINPEQDLFPIKYHFYNASQEMIRVVNLTVNTSFPKINKTSFWYKNFTRIAARDTLMMVVDTTISTKSFGYIGCTQQMEVNLHVDINDSITYISTWVTKKDTIRRKEDSQIYFRWPTDTIKAQKTQGYYHNRKERPYRGG